MIYHNQQYLTNVIKHDQCLILNKKHAFSSWDPAGLFSVN